MNIKISLVAWIISSFASLSSVCLAQTAAPPDEDPSKFFLFHAQGISAATARADYSYCIDQVKGISSFRERIGYGGGLLGGRLAEIDRFRMRNAGMRKCMHLHGYDRYQVPQIEWKRVVNEGDIVLDNKGQTDPNVIERMAQFAAGPQPATRKLAP